METEKLLNIAQASKLLGVAQSTLRRWEKEGRLIPDERTKGGRCEAITLFEKKLIDGMKKVVDNVSTQD